MKAILIALTAAALAVAATPTSAQPSALGDQYSVTIPFGDLNLDSAKGMSDLQTRIAAGSKEACGRSERGNMHVWNQIQRCRKHFLTEAQQQVDVITRSRSVTVIAGSK